MRLRKALLSTSRGLAALGSATAFAVIAMPTGANAAATPGALVKVPAARAAPSVTGSPDVTNCTAGKARGDIAITPGCTITPDQAGSYELILQPDGSLVVHAADIGTYNCAGNYPWDSRS
ncbi:hypothetical protein GXW82_03705 [Streptacidiphilus sp. 4-A2]|nr:hypothetical protein [Streptacidiphilus sp. 4-A2]